MFSPHVRHILSGTRETQYKSWRYSDHFRVHHDSSENSSLDFPEWWPFSISLSTLPTPKSHQTYCSARNKPVGKSSHTNRQWFLNKILSVSTGFFFNAEFQEWRVEYHSNLGKSLQRKNIFLLPRYVSPFNHISDFRYAPISQYLGHSRVVCWH